MSSVPRRGVSLNLEQLEDRVCPSTVALPFTQLEGTTGSPHELATAVFRAELPLATTSEPYTITLRDVAEQVGGSPGIFSGADIDCVKLSEQLITSAEEFNDASGLDLFDFSPQGTLFTPGIARRQVNPITQLAGADDGVLDNTEATLDVADGDSDFFNLQGGYISLGEGGQLRFTLTKPMPQKKLFLYVGELGGTEQFEIFVSHEPTQRRVPTIVIPGILGSLTTNMVRGLAGKFDLLRNQLTNFILAGNSNGLGITKPYSPLHLVAEQVNHSYDELLASLQREGYTLGRDLFFAAYDWRLPVLVNPADPSEVLWDRDGVFESGVEYLDWWITRAKQAWRGRYGSINGFSVNIVAHSMGGLLARAYVQEGVNAGQKTVPVSNLIMLGTPNHGSVSTYAFWKATLTMPQLGLLDADSWFRRALVVALQSKPGSTPSTLIPSLRDLMPDFPFVTSKEITTPIAFTGNYLLQQLNANTAALTANTKVLLIGSSDILTPVKAKLLYERAGRFSMEWVLTIRFTYLKKGDGRVVWDRFGGSTTPAGLLLPGVDTVNLAGARHDELPTKGISTILNTLKPNG